MAEPPLLVDTVCRRPQSGAQKKRKRTEKNSLPRPFFIYDVAAKKVHGAMLVVDCAKQGMTTLVWVVAAVVLLDQPRSVVPRSDIKYHQSVVAFQPAFELPLRTADAKGGGALNHHFLEHAAISWLAWPLKDDNLKQVVSFDGTSTVRLTTKASLAQNVGVAPSNALTAHDALAPVADPDDEASNSMTVSSSSILFARNVWISPSFLSEEFKSASGLRFSELRDFSCAFRFFSLVDAELMLLLPEDFDDDAVLLFDFFELDALDLLLEPEELDVEALFLPFPLL